jgi:hypothetical protein
MALQWLFQVNVNVGLGILPWLTDAPADSNVVCTQHSCARKVAAQSGCYKLSLLLTTVST